MKLRHVLLSCALLSPALSAKDITISPGESLAAARDAAHKGDHILLKGGTYRLDAPLLLGPQNSGVTWSAAPGEKPVISGGVVVSGWTPDTNGRFKATVNLDNFRQLWVNGQRAQRARGAVPANMADWGKIEATVKKGTNPPGTTGTPGCVPCELDKISPAGYTTTDVKLLDWKNPQDIEFGYNGEWTHPIVKVEKISKSDDGKVIIEMSQPGLFLNQRKGGFQIKLPYYMENALELLDQPGQWYFDRPAHTLYYIPRPGEDMAKVEVIAPKLETLVEVKGTLENPVTDIRFEGLTFSHATWLRPSSKLGHPDAQANFIQPADNSYFRPENEKGWVPVNGEHVKSPANIIVDAGRGISFESCVFTALGGAGLDLQNGAQGNSVNHCMFTDISGSGIQIGGVSKEDHHPSDVRSVVKDNRISNNTITKVGQDYYASVGIFYGYTEGTVISHNEISWSPYSGITGGWGWGMLEVPTTKFVTPMIYTTPTPCKNNIIEGNNIHHFMLLRRDGGGVYMLGRQTGTVIRGNCIHDAGPGTFGGIYLDEGSADIEACGNLLYNFPAHAYHFNNYLADYRDTCRVHDNSIVKTDGVVGHGTKGGSGFDVGAPDPPIFTITAWVRLYNYPNSSDKRRWVVCRGANPAAGGNISLYVKDKNVSGSINMGGGEKNCHVAEGKGDPLKTNEWTLVAVSYDGDTLRVYCNGKEVGNCKVGKPRSSGNAPLTIGARADLISSFDNGEIDEVSLYGRALTAEEIAKAGKDANGALKHVDFETQPDGNDFSKTESLSGPQKAEK